MNILLKANELVNGSRQEAYGPPPLDFARTAQVWQVVLGPIIAKGKCVTPEHVGLCMAGLKLVRESWKHQTDNLVDMAGYAQTVQMVHDNHKGSDDD